MKQYSFFFVFLMVLLLSTLNFCIVEAHPDSGSWSIQNSGDDAYERGNGDMKTGLNYIQVGNFSNDYTDGGFHFISVTVPQGATISEANITCTRNAGAASGIYTDLYGGSDVLNQPAFSEAVAYDISSRARTSASVAWDDPWPSGGTYTKEITAIVQELINNASWSSGANITIIMITDEGVSSSYQRCHTIDQGGGYEAVLKITWTSGVTKNFSGSISVNVNVGYSKAFSFSFYTSINPIFTVESRIEFITGQILNLSGLITQIFSIDSEKSMSFSLMKVINPSFTISSLTDFAVPGLLNLFGSINVVFGIDGITDLALPIAYATEEFVLYVVFGVGILLMILIFLFYIVRR